MQLMQVLLGRAGGSLSIRAGSFVLLFGSLVSVWIVCDRAVAALWQAYKFYGYSTPGAVTLSLETGLAFTFVTMVLLLLAVITGRVSKCRSENVGAVFSKFAALLYLSSFSVYWLIALSAFNQWR